MSTFSAKPADVVHEWFVIDATDKVLGRVASEVALRLRGKHKAIYTPHVDTGDFIVIINASKLKVTGTKSLDKVYYRHSGYPGGITATNLRDMQAKHPGLLECAARVLGLHVTEVCSCDTAWITRVTVVHLVQRLGTSDLEFGCVDDDDEVTCIDVGCVNGFVFAA